MGRPSATVNDHPCQPEPTADDTKIKIKVCATAAETTSNIGQRLHNKLGLSY